MPAIKSLNLKRATYGLGARTVDVTDAVRERIESPRILVSNNLTGGSFDPAPGHIKYLTVWYTVGDSPQTFIDEVPERSYWRPGELAQIFNPRI